ncbi:MAG: UDP-3-O-(3-hydroxymyristoyl)glucosamine N-acyltransferase [Candidatus Argoarchaeum ethanivorans]|uniref:UDP-3-O-(3-hydroxymyristoyl)glucosamine N-acyltransferase n=1 Tax=Candidatus Argoarchaeum ethanivorans TaxID=2608793 RepID=A0A812A2A8_9EURY|nr:MAG: UDP-3-O-(3-hydroxymyristoyl)glucosamine N-acyltransferase [Candidatus Argoarchaeum ethanivorans]
MIKSKKDLKYYIKQDLKSHGLSRIPIIRRFYPNSILFTIKMRKLEYLRNCKRGIIWKLVFWILYFRWKLMGIKLGFSIGLFTFEHGVSIQHHGCIIIHKNVKIGCDCRIHNCVNIGRNIDGVPTIGDNVYIGPGAKIFGNISIGNNVMIGANAVVNKSFPNDVTIAGVPAIIVSKESRIV